MKFKLSNILFISLAVFSLFVGLSCICAADVTDTYDQNFTLGGLDTPMPHAIDDANRPDIHIVNENIKELIEAIINGEYPPCFDESSPDSTDVNCTFISNSAEEGSAVNDCEDFNSTFIENTATETGGTIVGTLNG